MWSRAPSGHRRSRCTCWEMAPDSETNTGPTAESTAIRPSPSVVGQLEPLQGLEPGVDLLVRMVMRAFVEPASAHGAQTRAIGPAQRRDRLGELDRLANGRLEV